MARASRKTVQRGTIAILLERNVLLERAMNDHTARREVGKGL
jgi:hypothetical protein